MDPSTFSVATRRTFATESIILLRIRWLSCRSLRMWSKSVLLCWAARPHGTDDYRPEQPLIKPALTKRLKSSFQAPCWRQHSLFRNTTIASFNNLELHQVHIQCSCTRQREWLSTHPLFAIPHFIPVLINPVPVASEPLKSYRTQTHMTQGTLSNLMECFLLNYSWFA